MNTFVPNVISSLICVAGEEHDINHLEDLRSKYERLMRGESTGVSSIFNGVELDFEKVRQVYSYGRLMHSDRNKYVCASVLSKSAYTILSQQTNLLFVLINDLCSLIDRWTESGLIFGVSETLKDTWLDVHQDPASYGVGRPSSDAREQLPICLEAQLCRE
ncbi:hypothetical protein M3C63_12875 [Brevibacterium luteolum]|uniref:hypothetical protein n=1 Tax=Brevibacterium luteolum TaxID=199591 RepID=UPI00223B24D2|nr:hypothetical protein [Brevibacterium luteolum]MCT1922742.1 hypothetical protein [Brevibacterium luteolum]